jgi:hypothetical protein
MTPHPFIKDILKDLSEAGLKSNLEHFTKLKEASEKEVAILEERRQELLAEAAKRGISLN